MHVYERAELEDSHVIVRLRVGFAKLSGRSFEQHVAHLVDLTSFSGSCCYKGELPQDRKTHALKVVFLAPDDARNQDEARGIADLAIPVALCPSREGLPLLLSALWYSAVYSFVQEFHVLEIAFPRSYVEALPGPRFGTAGAFFGGGSRPLIGLILKPRGILKPAHANVAAYAYACAGVDYVIDDELTVDPDAWSFEDRVSFVVDLLAQAANETGRTVPYIVNVTACHDRALELAEKAHELGAAGVMMNCVTMGYDELTAVARSPGLRLFVVANVIGRNLVCGGPNYRLAEPVLGYLARLSGADAVYIGPLGGPIQAPANQSGLFLKALAEAHRDVRHGSYAVMSGGVTVRSLLQTAAQYEGPLMLQMGSGLCAPLEASADPLMVMSLIRRVCELYFERKLPLPDIDSDIVRQASKRKMPVRLLQQLGWQ